MKDLRSILAGMVVVMLLVVSGCNTAGKAFARSLASTAAHQAVVSGVQNEIEGPRGTTVNVVQGQASNSTAQSRYYDGKLTNGSHYKGELFNNRPHGLGSVVLPSGSKYVGQFKAGSPDGQGTSTFANGEKYAGQWKAGKFDGQGTYTLQDGREYVGQFKAGQRHGQGSLACTNGVFVGEFRSGREHKGTFTGKNGIIITGIFTGEEKSGTIVYPDGRKYEGEWSGVADPSQPGEWVYERPHGVGKMTYPDGKIEEGIWRKGKFLGKLVK